MKIYVCHSKNFDYKKELYEPIRNSSLNNLHEFIFPHENDGRFINSKEIIPSCDLIIAEVSYPSIGMGIELGWANKDDKRIICFYKKDLKISNSLKTIANDFIEYQDKSDLIQKLESILKNLKKIASRHL